MFRNEYDIEFMVERARANDKYYALQGAELLQRLLEWTNENSDGWAYWPKPRQAADKLGDLLWDAAFSYSDISDNDLKRLVRPIKAFLTRQRVDPDVKRRILGSLA